MYNSDMSKSRRLEKSKIINIILENHFEKFKKEKLHRIKSKEMRELLKDLQNAAYGVISHYYKEKVKENHEVGLIAVVHTFGSD